MALSRAGKIAAVAAAVVVSLAVALLIAVASLVPFSAEAARKRLIASLSERLDAEVELQELRVHAIPSLRAEGRGLTIRHRGRRDVPPLISIAHFAAEGSVLTLLHKHISRVEIAGLDIQIPPDRNRDADDPGSDDQHKDDADGGDQKDDGQSPARAIVIDHLFSTSARLSIIPDESGKVPRVWDIHNLHMQSISVDKAMPYEATLTNAVPPGEIVTQGTFGPWHRGEPGHTPLDGTFTFDRADLGVFKGISGILSAHGQFEGRLARIDIHGETETPQFKLDTGHPVPLHTSYHAIVDGTNGNTLLEEVNASFFNTSIVAKGGVGGKPGVDGRTVTLDVAIDRGRLEDILALAVKTPKAPMTGALQMRTTLLLPPGDRDVVKKLRLKGRFSIMGTRFTDLDVQRKISELSQRSRGKHDEQAEPRIVSRFKGQFSLANGTLEIPKVSFDVPGSLVELKGRYALVPETLDFRGTLFMDVKVSETTTGFKRLFLKIADPFFRREGGGSAIPIRISGKRSDPSFGLDKGRVFSRKQ